MDLAPVRTLALDVAFHTMGVPATVTRPAPDNTPIATTIIWLAPLETDTGADLHRLEPRRPMALRRSEVPTAPRGTVITAPDQADGVVRMWRVEGPAASITRHGLTNVEQTRVIVILDA